MTASGSPPADPRLAFLEGGGEMGARMRALDWSRTPLGEPAGWPPPLKTLVGLMLASEQPMFIAWGSGQTWLYNTAFVPIMGAKHPERLGRHALDEVWREAHAVLEPLFARVFAGEPVHMQDFELELDRHGRLEEAHFAFSYTPVRDDAGRVVALFGACIEITERVRAEQALRESEAQLREADRRKDAFLAILAHELRNPLAPIRQAVRVAKSPDRSAAQLEWAHGVIERQSAQMALLLDDLLDMSRITHGQLTLRKTRIALDAVLDAAVETARPLLDARRQVLERALPGQPVLIEADGLRLSQVVSNLLTNAAKYTDPGGRIELGARCEGATLEIRVRDSGIGMDEETLTRIFQTFSQAQDALERAQGGLGVGLALVKGLVELHGGTVAAHSAGPGKGSEFVVTLPRAVADGEAPSAALAVPAPSKVVRRRILVVDDNTDAAESLKLLLELDGHEVRLAHDGAQALAAIGVAAPDVVFLDIGMPTLNGYEAARRIRLLPGGAALKLAAVTGWGQPSDRKRALEAGFDVHLTKPVDHAKVKELLQRL